MDECRIEMVDGVPVLLRGARGRVTEQDRAALADVIRAAQRKVLADDIAAGPAATAIRIGLGLYGRWRIRMIRDDRTAEYRARLAEWRSRG